MTLERSEPNWPAYNACLTVGVLRLWHGFIHVMGQPQVQVAIAVQRTGA